ncbi:ISL3 family transposase [Yimella sp. cx-51]|nr:ISL3 family transposase [Yimella sp. cx-51]MBC9956184.1 ISL3 family transposase [Yimella sp. cx-51]QTH39490.1 ISL3 family transposase [Yimella sp. cx-51]
MHVIDVEHETADRVVVTVESPPGPVGCPTCAVVAVGHGRDEVWLVDAPAFGRPVRIRWRKRRWRCLEPSCPRVVFVEQDDRVAAPRCTLTTRACWWAIEQLRREHASINGIRRQLGTGWESIRPLLRAAADDPARFDGVTILGVDEHVWHHVSTKPVEHGGRGPKELTGMVDLTPDTNGDKRTRLLDLVPGRSGKAYTDWLDQRGEAFRDGVQIATLDPFRGYKNAIDDRLEDTQAVLDAFHVVKLATHMVDEVRRRVQQQLHGHRGRKSDPLYRIRNILRAGEENLTDRQRARLAAAWAAHEAHLEVELAWQCAQQVRSVYHQDTHAAGRRVAERILDTFTSCPIREVARLGRTLKQWRTEFLGYFDTHGASNGGTEAMNGLIELHRRIARGFHNRDNYRLRMLLIGGGLNL